MKVSINGAKAKAYRMSKVQINYSRAQIIGPKNKVLILENCQFTTLTNGILEIVGYNLVGNHIFTRQTWQIAFKGYGEGLAGKGGGKR